MKLYEGAATDPSGSLNAPVTGVCPSAATEAVNASAMSDRSALTADDDIVVDGINAGCGSV
jgi:hypothetical protein